ncbi:MAG: hypothetical protein ABI725_05995 [Chloroflexota bacterium]
MSKTIDEARERFVEADAIHERNRQDDSLWAEWQRLGVDYWVLRHPELKRYRQLERDRPLEVREIADLADALNHSKGGIPFTWRIGLWNRDRAENSARVAWFHELHRSLYGPVEVSLERVRNGDMAGLETLIRFLEADPYCHRSGYWKAEIINTITRWDVGETTRNRLTEVMFAVIAKPTRREFRRYIRLARYLDDERLRQRLIELANARIKPASRHASWILAGLEREGTSPPRVT